MTSERELSPRGLVYDHRADTPDIRTAHSALNAVLTYCLLEHDIRADGHENMLFAVKPDLACVFLLPSSCDGTTEEFVPSVDGVRFEVEGDTRQVMLKAKVGNLSVTILSVVWKDSSEAIARLDVAQMVSEGRWDSLWPVYSVRKTGEGWTVTLLSQKSFRRGPRSVYEEFRKK